MSRPRVIAFYLPQYHPFPENDEWWGKGFTEWTNVAKAKPLFPGHYQPRIPADLGFYDLRVPETREAQAKLAKEAGIEGFCYYHYWFGNKNTPKELMQLPFKEVVKTGKPDFPFCLCWANHSFAKKNWNNSVKYTDNTNLVEQKYYGMDDYIEHFYSLLSAFKDKRYIKVEGKLLFSIYNIEDIPNLEEFINCWNNEAKKNGLNGFYFIGYYSYYKKETKQLTDVPYSLCDGNIYDMTSYFTKDSPSKKNERYFRKLLGILFHFPCFKYDYRKSAEKWIPKEVKKESIFPIILPNFDHSPRSGNMGLIFDKNSPMAFKNQIEKAVKYISHKSLDRQIIFLKSWNEWGEGNYMEPDLRYGHAYLDALRSVILPNNI